MTEQQQHPISPPEHLVRKWTTWRNNEDAESFWRRIAMEAAQWGADQELEACCELANSKFFPTWGDELHAARRPEPLSLREQALTRTTAILNDPGRVLLIEVRETLELNLRALETLPE